MARTDFEINRRKSKEIIEEITAIEVEKEEAEEKPIRRIVTINGKRILEEIKDQNAIT